MDSLENPLLDFCSGKKFTTSKIRSKIRPWAHQSCFMGMGLQTGSFYGKSCFIFPDNIRRRDVMNPKKGHSVSCLTMRYAFQGRAREMRCWNMPRMRIAGPILHPCKNSRLFFGYKKKRLKWIQNNLFWVSNLFKVMVLAQASAFKADESGKLSWENEYWEQSLMWDH